MSAKISKTNNITQRHISPFIKNALNVWSHSPKQNTKRLKERFEIVIFGYIPSVVQCYPAEKLSRKERKKFELCRL